MDTELHLVPPIDCPSPTITESDRIAAEVGEAIDALAARIPRLAGPHPSTAGHVRGARTISRAFLASMIAVADRDEALSYAAHFDADEARETLQFIDAFRPIADRLAFLLASLNYTMELRKANVAEAALRAYAVAKGMARDPDSAALASGLETLRRDLGRKRPHPER
jgi:hypothetical protein